MYKVKNIGKRIIAMYRKGVPYVVAAIDLIETKLVELGRGERGKKRNEIYSIYNILRSRVYMEVNGEPIPASMLAYPYASLSKVIQGIRKVRSQKLQPVLELNDLMPPVVNLKNVLLAEILKERPEYVNKISVDDRINLFESGLVK